LLDARLLLRRGDIVEAGEKSELPPPEVVASGLFIEAFTGELK
jgi:hypothetical protein